MCVQGARKWEVGSGKWEVGSGKREVGSGRRNIEREDWPENREMLRHWICV